MVVILSLCDLMRRIAKYSVIQKEILHLVNSFKPKKNMQKANANELFAVCTTETPCYKLKIAVTFGNQCVLTNRFVILSAISVCVFNGSLKSHR